ncbi:hypothetical protein BDY19DRAFT_888372 [Irpex rosettiformis]|uniref:Uncharacterized protein n=1 Tax=Irpex rosettiformis TaxID=378272 RepID=A0ACB8U780_9APHY|nr:hypothetical protein BDY19DRAFT_888372 [Irpex rosettiformis]
MAPTKKAKAAGVSASSFLDLKAELSRKEEELSKAKASGKVVAAVKRPNKKPTIWTRPNKGVEVRMMKDIEDEVAGKPTLESARASLERKSKIYEKLSKGKSGGLNDKQYDALLVDFDSKPIGPYGSDSDDVDESLTVPQKPRDDDDDPIIEYEDEFGRVRTGRRSEVPRHLLEPEEPAEEDIEYSIHNPVNHFPTYEPSEERKAAIQAQLEEEENPLNLHYDASREVRAKGAGFYQFSGDEETRGKQMKELKQARLETEKTRAEAGAIDLHPGEIEGMGASEEDESAAGASTKSRAAEKRKREIEERRKLLEAKRRKKDPAASSSEPRSTSVQSSLSSTLAAPQSTTQDPFAMLEAQSAPARKPNNTSMHKPTTDADAFLAGLEMDIRQSKRG